PKSAAQKKNEKRKEARKLKKEADESGAAAPDAPVTKSGPAAPAAADTVADQREAAEKKIRALNKKLRQIHELEDRTAKDPLALDDAQKAKVAAKPDLENEIKALGELLLRL
ncbi:hypothetical protein HDU91_001934, partial [Kappamyces sp. JEL0680]